MGDYRLFTPGPADIPADVVKSLSRPLVYHRAKEFAEIFNRVRKNLKLVIGTSGEIFFFCASGTGAMEAAVVNLLSPDEDVLVAVCGRFGERWLNICKRYNSRPQFLSVRYGESVEAAQIEEILTAHPEISTVFTTLTETSTGALIDIKAIGAVTRKLDKVLVVDGIAGLAADEFYMDDWNVDVVIGASQKALMSPPGIAFLAINQRGWQKVLEAKLPRFYWDLINYNKFAADGQTPYTPAINIFFTLDVCLNKIIKKGVEGVFNHHREIAGLLRNGIGQMDLKIFPRHTSNALTVIAMPEGIDGTKVVTYVKENHHILFANGQGDLRGRIIRIGHMGEYSKKDMIDALEGFARGCEFAGLKINCEEVIRTVRNKI